jgi:hypothetical protein
MMNKLAHGIVLVFFALASWCVWASFKIPAMVRPGMLLPAFTRLCMAVGPSVVIALAVLAAIYCLWVWCRKAPGRNSWVAFLATSTSALLFVMLPSGIATSIALIGAINNLAAK